MDVGGLNMVEPGTSGDLTQHTQPRPQAKHKALTGPTSTHALKCLNSHWKRLPRFQPPPARTLVPFELIMVAFFPLLNLGTGASWDLAHTIHRMYGWLMVAKNQLCNMDQQWG